METNTNPIPVGTNVTVDGEHGRVQSFTSDGVVMTVLLYTGLATRREVAAGVAEIGTSVIVVDLPSHPSHVWYHDEDGSRCGDCDVRMMGTSAQWPCRSDVPRANVTTPSWVVNRPVTPVEAFNALARAIA